jgi:carbonic anhydrase/SulP family sulfate permease
MRDVSAGLVVFVVALPLCLGIALASGAPLFAGVMSGIIGGVLVGLLSGSHTSVSGPGNSMMALAAAQIAALGSFESFLLAVVIAGAIQLVLGIMRAGWIAAFFPSSVIKGLLAAIGIILIMKQVPHLLGHDTDPEGDMAFSQPDHENTLSEFGELWFDIHPGATLVGLTCVAVLVLWDQVRFLKKSMIPSQLVVVVVGVVMSQLLQQAEGRWAIGANHLVQVPIADSFEGFLAFMRYPDYSQWNNPAVYTAALTIAMVASLETLLNLEAGDRIDPRQRVSPPSRELWAQGVGNVVAGMLGGIPITSVVVRSSINIDAGAQTKMATVFHGLLLLVSVALFPAWLNTVPLACLAAILLVAGFKLASPSVFKEMWAQGRYQFLPFVLTVLAIVFTDLLIGILIGLGVALSFILNSNLRRPLRRFVEQHLGGDVLHIQLANQVSFLNRAVLNRVLREVPRGGHVLLDAQNTDYIDPDVLDLIRDFKTHSAPARGIEVSFLGFRDKYKLKDQIQYVDYSTRELQEAMTPDQVLTILKDGHHRFRSGHRLTRDLGRQVNATADGQHPLAVVLSCIDSRTPAELIFDLGVGDIFVVRIAGNISSRKVLGSLEYGCAVAHAKLILVMGHTRCGAVTTAVTTAATTESIAKITGCPHVESVLREVQESIDLSHLRYIDRSSPQGMEQYVNEVARANVLRTVEKIVESSEAIRKLVNEGKVAVIGAIYDVVSGDLEFLSPDGASLEPKSTVTGGLH